ncbi:hypothetical protein [Brevibacterium luteolum]|uniref:hypothetical protein n=1 Tax=Brevibacterium luteolum TaxID=199591 RepID=UPI00223BA7FB|nr:hypothetical protein [Brevibacterium luteolum]MCT1828662.1 hypothetical protein [Brevibacterium luteolum]MCT1920734.1 hypothetical protein [Brevibacterium luteolum]
MEPIFAAAIVLAFIAVGELVSIWSKARVPGLLVAMLGAFIFAQLGLIPADVIDQSMLMEIYAILVVPLLFHMGSLIPLPTMIQQWRSVVIAICGMLVAVLILAAVVTPLFSFEHFVAGAGPLAGGIVATGLTTEGLSSAGVASAIVILPSLVLMMQSLPAMPLTNFLLRRFALSLRDSDELDRLAAQSKTRQEDAATGGAKKKLVTLPPILANNELFVLFLILVGGSLATLLAIPTHIPSSILGLLLGIISTAIGLTPERSMEKSSSFGIAMAGVVAIVMAPLLTASMADVIAALLPMVTILIIGCAGILIGGFIATKLLRWRPALGMSVALTAMYGFPADYLLTNEVARSVGRDEEEREKLLNAMLPPMLVGGFTSVSAGSVAIASVLVSFL